MEWTSQHLSQETINFLQPLPSTVVVGDFTLAHGSPREPVWEYVMEPNVAQLNFDEFSTPYCLVGHSHFPLVFHHPDGDGPLVHIALQGEQTTNISPRMILNPGSVGQPRDMDPRASYAMLDTKALTWEIRRVPYDIQRVQARILEAGLPPRQALRLNEGW